MDKAKSEAAIAQDINYAIGYYNDLGIMCPRCFESFPDADNLLHDRSTSLEEFAQGKEDDFLFCPRCHTKVIITVRIEYPNEEGG